MGTGRMTFLKRMKNLASQIGSWKNQEALVYLVAHKNICINFCHFFAEFVSVVVKIAAVVHRTAFLGHVISC